MDENAVVEEMVDNGPSAEDLAALDAINAIGEEFQGQVEAEPEEGEETAPDDSETPVEADAPQPEPEEGDRGTERLIQRELDLRAREDAVKGFEAKESQYQAQVKDLEARVQSFAPAQNFVEQIALTPMAALQAVGHDPDQIMRLYLAEKMTKAGKPVPPELQQEISNARQTAEVKALKQQITQNEQMRAAEAFAAQVERGAHEYVKKGQFSKDVPIIAELAKANPDEVFSEILDEIATDASRRAGKDNGNVISFEEAAKRAEIRLARYRKLLGPAPAAPTNATAKTSTKVATPGASATPKTPGKPLTKPKAVSEDDLINQAVNEGVSEFKRSEAARRKA